MTLKKKHLKTKEICKVTFILEPEVVGEAEKAFIVGEFNNWSETKNPLKKLKNGTFKTTLDLDKNKEYQFRYLVDGKWINDNKADKYVPNEFSSENAVVTTVQ